jgi:hypothetical protein
MIAARAALIMKNVPEKENAVRFLGGTALFNFTKRRLLGGGGLGGGGNSRCASGATGLGAGKLGILLLEAFHAAGGIDELLLPGVKRVADAADFDFDMLERAAGFERVSARAPDFRKVVLGVNFLFHDILAFQRQIQSRPARCLCTV